MERRDFLATVALGAGALGSSAIWLPGCGGAVPPRAMSSGDASDLLARLDGGLRTVRAGLADERRIPEAARRTLGVGLEALVVADVARSIPAGTELPREVARRIGETLPILDECVVTYHALLDGAPPSLRRKIDRELRRDPAKVMDVAEALDGRACALGVSSDSRTRMRRIATTVGTRIRHQSSSAVIDDCLAKVDRVVEHQGADLRVARSGATTAMIQSIWQQVDGMQPGAGPPPGGTPRAEGEPPAHHLGDPAYYPPPAPLPAPPPEEPERSPGDSELVVGGVLIGVGLGVFGIGGIISAAMSSIWPVVFAATPGGILVIVGLVFLIVGGVQNAAAG